MLLNLIRNYFTLIWFCSNRDSTRGFLEGYYTQGVPILIEETNIFDIFFLSFSPKKYYLSYKVTSERSRVAFSYQNKKSYILKLEKHCFSFSVMMSTDSIKCRFWILIWPRTWNLWGPSARWFESQHSALRNFPKSS